jgi:hypothetical protein
MIDLCTLNDSAGMLKPMETYEACKDATRDRSCSPIGLVLPATPENAPDSEAPMRYDRRTPTGAYDD